jgi:hypothetical protein
MSYQKPTKTAAKPAARPTAKPAAKPAGKAAGAVVTIDLVADEIKKKAHDLSQMKKSYDDWVWLWAEADLKLKNALITPLGAGVTSVKVDIKKIVEKPVEEEIRKLAKEYHAKRMKVQDIHWFIAERNFIMAKAKKA